MRTVVAGAFALVLHAGGAAAQDLPPQFGRYMPLYPGLYLNAGYTQDDRDRSYDAFGRSRPSATPQTPGRSAFPEKSAIASFTWHFPMFESGNVSFFSSRMHLARVTLRQVETRATGAIAAFAADDSDDGYSEADKLENNGSGIGDLSLEFGSFLYGAPSKGWRERKGSPLTVLALFSGTLPYGAYNRDAPVNAGSNTPALGGTLGLHWQPWPGGFLDAGVGRREYFQNYDPQFGATAPTEQGDDTSWDIGFAQRIVPGLYVNVFFTDREGDANLYENPRFAPNQAGPPNATTSNDPKPGNYYDRGTKLNARGIALQYFITQRWLAGLHYTHPQYGKGGQFLLPYEEHSPAGCINGSPNCQVMAGETILVDGMGPARVYSTDRLTLTVSYNFGQGDTFTCTGCKQ
jgi:hypothetical protein